MKVCKNDENPYMKDTALCGLDILNGHMSTRIIRSKFLTDIKAISTDINDSMVPLEKVGTDVNFGTSPLNNGREFGTAYPAPPPIKKTDLSKLVINIQMKK